VDRLLVTQQGVFDVPPRAAISSRQGVWLRVVLVALCALLVFITESTFRTRKISASAPTLDAQVLAQLTVWGLAGLLGLLSGGLAPRNIKGPTAVCALFIFVMLLSAGYSPEMRLTAVSAVGYGAFFAFALALRRHCSDREILTGLGIGLSLVVLSAPILFFAHAEPAKALQENATAQQRIHGLAEHAAALGALAAALVIVSVSLLRMDGLSRWGARMWKFVAFGAVVVLGLAFAKTAIIALCVSGLLMVWRRRPLLRALSPIWAVGIAAFVAIVAAVGIDNLLPRSIVHFLSRGHGSSNDVGTLTGRTRIWELVISKIERSPLFGYGWNTGRIEIYDKASRFPQIHSHNMYLQCLLYLGIVGFVLFAVMIVYVLAAFARRPLLWRDWIAIYLLILGLAEQSSLTNMPTAYTLLWLLVIASLRPTDSPSKPTEQRTPVSASGPAR
jgi:exopolysaccharide production protein ExoQ